MKHKTLQDIFIKTALEQAKIRCPWLEEHSDHFVIHVAKFPFEIQNPETFLEQIEKYPIWNNKFGKTSLKKMNLIPQQSDVNILNGISFSLPKVWLQEKEWNPLSNFFNSDGGPADKPIDLISFEHSKNIDFNDENSEIILNAIQYFHKNSRELLRYGSSINPETEFSDLRNLLETKKTWLLNFQVSLQYRPRLLTPFSFQNSFMTMQELFGHPWSGTHNPILKNMELALRLQSQRSRVVTECLRAATSHSTTLHQTTYNDSCCEFWEQMWQTSPWQRFAQASSDLVLWIGQQNIDKTNSSPYASLSKETPTSVKILYKDLPVSGPEGRAISILNHALRKIREFFATTGAAQDVLVAMRTALANKCSQCAFNETELPSLPHLIQTKCRLDLLISQLIKRTPFLVLYAGGLVTQRTLSEQGEPSHQHEPSEPREPPELRNLFAESNPKHSRTEYTSFSDDVMISELTLKFFGNLPHNNPLNNAHALKDGDGASNENPQEQGQKTKNQETDFLQSENESSDENEDNNINETSSKNITIRTPESNDPAEQAWQIWDAALASELLI